jgi:DNA gyrase subunit B
VEETREMFDVLLGDNLKGRKEFIEENGHRYLEMIDLA